MQRKTEKIDLAGQSLGRVASHIALALMGKNNPSYTPSIDEGDIVIVKNSDKITLAANKKSGKVYYSFSGYPGGRKKITLEQVVNKKGYEELVKKAVWNMLPKNRLRETMIKRLK